MENPFRPTVPTILELTTISFRFSRYDLLLVRVLCRFGDQERATVEEMLQSMKAFAEKQPEPRRADLFGVWMETAYAIKVDGRGNFA